MRWSIKLEDVITDIHMGRLYIHYNESPWIHTIRRKILLRTIGIKPINKWFYSMKLYTEASAIRYLVLGSKHVTIALQTSGFHWIRSRIYNNMRYEVDYVHGLIIHRMVICDAIHLIR